MMPFAAQRSSVRVLTPWRLALAGHDSRRLPGFCNAGWSRTDMSSLSTRFIISANDASANARAGHDKQCGPQCGKILFAGKFAGKFAGPSTQLRRAFHAFRNFRHESSLLGLPCSITARVKAAAVMPSKISGMVFPR